MRQSGVALTELRAEPCVLPEGGFLVGDWHYFSSYAQADVRRINVLTREIERIGPITTDGNSRFAKIAVSRAGEFGPEGTVFASTWSIANGGFPEAILPSGAKWTYQQGGKLPIGRGGRWSSGSYGSSCGVGPGQLAFGDAAEGIRVVTLAQPSDPTIDIALYLAGAEQYTALGYNLSHGAHCFGHLGFAPPFGKSDAMDYYLAAHGHVA